MSSAIRTTKFARGLTAAKAEPMTSVVQTHTHQSTRELIESILALLLAFVERSRRIKYRPLACESAQQ
jgi:hypothetical protein